MRNLPVATALGPVLARPLAVFSDGLVVFGSVTLNTKCLKAVFPKEILLPSLKHCGTHIA